MLAWHNLVVRHFVLALLLIGSCRSKEKTPTSPSQAEPVVASVPTPALEAEVVALDAGQTLSGPLGILAPEARVPKRARERNVAALKKHRAGDFKAAILAFTTLVEEQPNYRTARYNLACSHSRQGDQDGAWSALRPLLERDYPAYSKRFREDSDLAGLRESPQGEAVRRFVRNLEKQWKLALADGVPTTILRRGHTVDEYDSGPRRVSLWPGVYMPSSGRFVPQTEPLEHTWRHEEDKGLDPPVIQSMLDVESQSVLLLLSSFSMGQILSAKLVVWDTSSGALLNTLDLSTEAIEQAEVGVQGDSIFGRVFIKGDYSDKPQGWTAWQQTDRTAKAPSVVQVPWTLPPTAPRGFQLLKTSIGYDATLRTLLLQETKRTITFEGRKVQIDGHSYQLGRAHKQAAIQHAIENPASNEVVLVSLRKNDDYNHSTVVQIDLDSGKTTRIVSGPGIFLARFDRRGQLYWRLGRKNSPGLPAWVLQNP